MPVGGHEDEHKQAGADVEAMLIRNVSASDD
jgi:hypothetical protein